jgi:hypothetical protein
MNTTNATYPPRKAYSQYGASMGRRDTLPDNPAAPVRLSLVRLRWCGGDYDAGGAYWGRVPGTWIYRALGDADDGETVAELYVRAESREAAKAAIRARVPGARFYR